MKKEPFYKISNPTTKEIFEAIINEEYVPLDKIQPKAKQINILLKDYWNTENILITMQGVTNTGGYPIFLADTASMYEVALENNEDWYNMSEEDQNEEIELLSSYLQTFETIFSA